MILLILLGLAVPALSDPEIFEGPCPSANISVVRNLNHEKFQGRWYILERYEANWFDDCSRMTYEWKEGRKFDVMLFEKRVGDGFHYSNCHLKETEAFSNAGRFHRRVARKLTDHLIVDTDYKNYSVVWTCSNTTDSSEQNLMVLARDPFFDAHSVEALNKVLEKKPFDRSRLKPIHHDDDRCYVS